MTSASTGMFFAGSSRSPTERQQSLSLRNMEWEGRIRPMTSWSALIMRGLGVAVLACAILAVMV